MLVNGIRTTATPWLRFDNGAWIAEYWVWLCDTQLREIIHIPATAKRIRIHASPYPLTEQSLWAVYRFEPTRRWHFGGHRVLALHTAFSRWLYPKSPCCLTVEYK